jgi:hypothetical protein
MTRALRTLLLLAPLSACGYDLSYRGQLVDESGVARQGLQVTLRDVGFSEGHFTDPDVIARAETVENVQTDEQGKFELTHHIGGGFGCGAESTPALVIAPDGPEGAVAVWVGGGATDNHIEVGALELPRALDAVVDQDGVGVALPSGATAAVVRVDGAAWLAGETGELPAAALQPCPRGDTCAHEVSLSWTVGSAHLRSAARSFTTLTPRPLVTSKTASAKLDAPATLGSIVLDGVFTEEGLTRTDTLRAPRLSVLLDPNFPVPTTMPADACKVYGTGVLCTGPTAPVYEISFDGGTGNLRAFAR